MSELALVMENLKKSYDDGGKPLEVLKGVDFSVKHGEVVAIVGRSGSGKSTILNMAGLLDRPDSGEVYIDGVPVSKLSEVRRTNLRGREIGFVFQNYHMLSDFNMLENVMLGAALGRGGSFGRRNRAKALEWLERVGLAERCLHRPGELSGGEQQRAAIARALMPNPAILLCDEPTGNLDSTTAEEVWGWLWNSAREAGMAMVVVTHENFLARKADRVMRLRDGVLEPETA